MLRGEKQSPLVDGDFEGEVSLPLHSGQGEGVPVHSPEEIRVCGDVVAEVFDIFFHFWLGIAASDRLVFDIHSRCKLMMKEDILNAFPPFHETFARELAH